MVVWLSAVRIKADSLSIKSFEVTGSGMPSNFESSVYWFDGDKYLSHVIRKEVEVFNNEFDLFNDSPLHLLPDCREFARKKFLNKASLESFLDWVESDSTDYDLRESLGLFFWEEVELVFVKHFSSNFKKFALTKSRSEAEEILLTSMLNLKGASMKRLATKKWE